MKRLAIFASGSGSNAENIAKYFRKRSGAKISIILTNNPKAFVIDRAAQLKIPVEVFDRTTFYDSNKILKKLQEAEIDMIILAGFLWLVPQNLLKAYPEKIINIHPALLPKYGGKGMYGMKVHEEVIRNQEKESGITIHYVDECYDEGCIIFQATCEVLPNDTAQTLADRVHKLEYRHFPEVIESLVMKS